MFQPLPVRLDHALNADTVRLGDARVGTLQEVELLAGKGRGAGRKLAAQPNPASPLSSPRRTSRASVRPPAIKGPSLGRRASVPHREGRGCPPPTSGVSDTKSTLDLRIYPSSAISSARSSTQILTQGQLSGWLREQRCLWGLQLGLGVGRTSYLAESEMDRKLITGLNNCRSVSPMGCPAHSNCCSAGIGEEGAIGIRQRAQ